MSQRIPLISADMVPDGTGVEVVAAGRIFAVYRTGDCVHVLDGICPHAGGPLGKGTLQNHIVTCPWHGWQFDVRTGQHCLSDQICQQRFEYEIADGMIYVNLPD